MTAREKCLNEAKNKVTGTDSEDYGKPEDNLQNIANLWSSYLNNKLSSQRIATYVRLTPEEVAQMMALFKIARIQGKHSTKDSYIDACGYIACAYECELGDKVK